MPLISSFLFRNLGRLLPLPSLSCLRAALVLAAVLALPGRGTASEQASALGWDPGTSAGGTVFAEQTSAAQTDFLYRIRSQNPASGAWRTVLRVTAGNADVYFRRGLAPDPANSAGSDFKSTRPTGDDGFVLNPAGQFAVGEDYFILVRSFAGASWRLFSGEVYVENLGALGFTDANGNGKFDPGETVQSQATAPRIIGGEGAIFYRATVPEGVPAWSLWLNGQTNKLAVRKNFVPFQNPVAPVFDVEKPQRMLLVPDYLQASTAGSAYFISVAGNPGVEVRLDSRIHSFTEIAYDSTTSVTGDGPGFRTYRVSVPPNQPAWSVSVTPGTGDPHVCLRRDKVASENDNNGYSEVASTTTADSITLSPASAGSLQEGLTDGTFFVTVYSTTGDYTATLRSGPVQVTDIAYQSTTLNDAPARAGWRFYRISDIDSQTGLGWELQLANHALNTEIAIRRNAVPSKWLFRTNGSQQSSSGILNLSSTTGLLQNPRHQRDVWYIGIYQPTLPLGEFSLTSRPLGAAPLDFTNAALTFSSLAAGRSHYWQVTVPANAKGWQLDLTRLLPVSGTADADCAFAVARDVVPSLIDTELNIPQEVGITDNSWPSSRQLKIDRTRDLVPLDKDGDNSRRYSVIIPMWMPLEPGTYFVGIRPKTTDVRLDLRSRGIGEGAAWPIRIGSMSITGEGAVPVIPPLALGEAAFFKIAVPSGLHAWEFTLDAPAGDCLLAVQRGLIPGASARESATILRPNTSLTSLPAALMARRAGAERLVLMESNGQTELPAGDYYVAVLSQGAAAAGMPHAPVAPALRSEGELAIQNAGPISAAPLTLPFTLAAGQIKAIEFTLPAGLTAAEVSVSSTTGNAVAAWWTGAVPRFPAPAKDSERYGFEGGEPDATAPGGIKLRLTNQTKQVLVHPSPAAGVYRVLLRAAIKTGSLYEPATGTFTIRHVDAADLAFDGGTATVTGQVQESWKFFAFDVPATAELLGWDFRVERATGVTGALTTSPEVIIRRDLPPPGGSSVSASAADWRSGDYWTVGSNWNGTPTSNNHGMFVSVVMPAGKPLRAGRYIAGIKARGADINYTVRSRGIGDGFSIPVTPLLPSANASGRLPVNALPFREVAYFKIDLTSPAAENFLVIADALHGQGDFRLALRSGGIPGSTALDTSRMSDAHGVLVAKSETGTAPLEQELYIALPASGQTALPAGQYYVALISEGTGGHEDSTVDCTIGAASPIPVEDLGTIPGDSEVLVERSFNLRGGAIVAYKADIAPNVTGRSASVIPTTGRSGLATNSGPTGRLPRPFFGDYYGLEGGDTGNGYLATTVSVGLCQDIPNGQNHFVIRALPGVGGWQSATGTFYLGSCQAFPSLDCDGGIATGILPGRSWTHYRVVVPAGISGWDLQCLSDQTVDCVIRRSAPADTVSPTVTQNATAWVPLGVYALNSDWSGVTRTSTNTPWLWGVIPMGSPLEPGTYFIGVRNNTDFATGFTLRSRAIGNAYTIPVQALDFSGPGAEVAAAPVAPKDARYFKFTIPGGSRSWEFDSQVTNGDVVLAVCKDRIPGSKADSSSQQGPYIGHGFLLDKSGHERMVLLPPNGEEFLTAGDYYVAMVSKGTGVSSSRAGALPADAAFRSTGAIPVQSLGTVAAGQPVSRQLAFSEAQIQAFEFDITTATPGVEVRLDDRAGLPRLALWTGDPRFIPEPPLSTPTYGFWGGSKTAGTAIRHEQDSIYTMANVAPGRYRLVLRACPSGGTFPSAACRLSISVKEHLPLAFGPLLETPTLSSRHQAQLVKGQKNLYSVNVPATYNGQEVRGWLIYTRQLSGTTGLRAFRLGGTTQEIAVSGQNSLLLAPPWFTPGQTWYLSVDGEGVAEYEVESRPVQLEQSPWVLPALFDQTFGDSAPTPQQTERPLSQDDWHFYAISIPDGNPGALRTMLETISGNPDLYIRAGAIPTTDHKLTGTSGADLFDRRLNGITTEYGNWVPEKGRSETQLPVTTWYLGVRAAAARNASYRLRAASATVTPLAHAGGTVNGETLAGGDWRYYLFTTPADSPETWRLNFNRTQGNAVLYIRDTIPPGDFNAAGSVKSDSSDNKNSGTYQSGGYAQPGLITYNCPNLRAGHRYWVGIRALSDAQYSLSSSIEGSLSSVPVLSLTDGAFNESLAPGETRLFRVIAPRGSTRLSATFNGTGNGMELRVEQASLPALTGNSHERVTSGNFSRALGTDPNVQWPWISGFDFYFRLTNISTTARTPALVLNGLAPVAPDTDNDGLLDSWERTHFNNAITAGALDDPDRDGLVNLLEFALGTPPNNPARTTQPVTVRLDASGRLVMEVTKPAATDLSVIQYVVEFSSDLINWTNGGSTLRDTSSVLEVRDTVSTAVSPERHVRLRVRRAATP